MASTIGILSLEEGGSISVQFDKPTSLQSVWVYPSTMQNYVPGSMDIEINGSYSIYNVAFGKDSSPAVFVLDNLPEGTLIESIKLTLHVAEGRTYGVLSEVFFIDKK